MQCPQSWERESRCGAAQLTMPSHWQSNDGRSNGRSTLQTKAGSNCSQHIARQMSSKQSNTQKALDQKSRQPFMLRSVIGLLESNANAVKKLTRRGHLPTYRQTNKRFPLPAPPFCA